MTETPELPAHGGSADRLPPIGLRTGRECGGGSRSLGGGKQGRSGKSIFFLAFPEN